MTQSGSLKRGPSGIIVRAALADIAAALPNVCFTPENRFAYVGVLAIQPFHYAQDVVADFHHLGGWRPRQDLARALC